MTLSENLEDTKKRAIEELRARTISFLTPELHKDSSLFYRFLKARDFDVDKTEKMLMKHITWRKVNQVSTILEDIEPKEFFHRYALPSVIGFDKEGDLVMYSPAGKLEASDILKCSKINDYLKCWIWFVERNLVLLKEQSEKTGKDCNRVSFIIDLHKLTLSNVMHKTTQEIWLHITNIFQDNYPERMKAVYVINAPAYYVLIFTILKSVMSAAMLQKIHVFGQNNWKEKLLEDIDADVLPAFLGGSRTDPDGNPLCLSFVKPAGKFSTQYYLSQESRYFKDISEVKKTVVPFGERKEIFLDVTKNQSIIKWEYLVKTKDIGFGLSFQKSEENMKEELIPVAKYSTVDGTQLGSYKCQSMGKYIIIFDNTHSWLSSKDIQYYLKVMSG